MDAYIFSRQSTPDAVGALANGVRAGGPARVVIPLIGSHRLYVAVQGADDAELAQRVSEVLGTQGLGGATAYRGSAPGGQANPFPTWGATDAYVGFCLLDTLPGLSIAVYDAAASVVGVIGAAVVTGAGYSVLVESTANDQEALALILNQVSGLPGVRSAATASGSAALGFGLTGRTAG